MGQPTGRLGMGPEGWGVCVWWWVWVSTVVSVDTAVVEVEVVVWGGVNTLLDSREHPSCTRVHYLALSRSRAVVLLRR